ncbi:MAG: ATP-binding protein [Desulfovibrionaceae bacterium]|nr:ATP-binding protein [Desulfovibrionaceae bacterium]MBF0514138.1 ATP-binding protein [Desulfovibrionaceae bacterium]
MNAFVFRCEAESKAARRLVKAVVALTGEYINDQGALHDLELALVEASSNVVRHAYQSDDRGGIEIRLGLKPGESVDVEVVDWGRGFANQVCYENAAPCSECGRGMFLISSLADGCEVRRNGGENVVAIHKNIGSPSWKN